MTASIWLWQGANIPGSLVNKCQIRQPDTVKLTMTHLAL